MAFHGLISRTNIYAIGTITHTYVANVSYVFHCAYQNVKESCYSKENNG